MKTLALVVTTGVALASLSVVAQAQDKLKACWAYVGPIGDFGYSYQHDQGRLEVQKELGDKVETSYLESVPEGTDADRAFERLAREGCKIIFGTSFGYMDSMVKVAARFPEVKFEHATGYKTADNLAIYNARFYQARYIMGQIAAKESKKGLAGYIVPFPIPEVIMGINSFMLGAQSVNPNFKIKTVWVNSFFDPGKEADAAKALFDQGVDVIVQHTDSTAALQVAQERGLKGFGQSSDMSKFAPKAQMTSALDNWAPYYVARVKAVLDGSWKTADTWSGMKEDTVEMAPFTNMSDDTKRLAQETEAKIKGGWHPFTGPVTKQDGTVFLKDGQVADDAALLEMNFFVKGIDEQLPQ